MLTSLAQVCVFRQALATGKDISVFFITGVLRHSVKSPFFGIIDPAIPHISLKLSINIVICNNL